MVDEKAWYESKTIWGALIAVVASAVSTLGYTIDASAQSELSDAVVQIVGALGAIIALYGRLTATRVIA